jgi:4-amino-4-deoxy-L-arabinose transferase-like glycosyltransferase
MWPILGGAVLVFSGIWVLPVCDTTEARYAVISREMMEGGDWLVPRRFGEPHLAKPPLTCWLSAASMEVFGPRAWAARLPGALAYLAAVAVVADLARSIGGGRAAGTWAGWALVFSALPVGAANILTTDSLVTFLQTAAAWCAWRSLTAESEKTGRRWALGLHAALGLGFLAKGPAGILVALPIAVFAILRHRSVPSVRLLRPSGLALFAAIAFPWFIAVGLKVPGAFDGWLHREMGTRIAGDTHRNMPAYAYIPILLGGTLPAGILLPAALRRACAEWRSRGDRARGIEFLALWAAIPFIVLCAARSRLPLYLLPLFPPLAVLTGLWLAERLQGKSLRPALAVGLVALAAGLWLGARLASFRIPAAVDLLDLADPRPAAEVIAGDAARSGKEPEVLATSPPLGFPGYGLSFYLGAPVRRVNIRQSGGTSPDELPAEPAREFFARPVRPGAAQYIAVRPGKVGMFEERVRDAGASGAWILSEGPLRVWRRGD